MEENKEKQQEVIDLTAIVKLLWQQKKTYMKVLPIVFILSCIWVLPKPRYYTCGVKLAPEGIAAPTGGGGLSSLASSFGFSMGSGSTDAIYPVLYPDVFSSTEFIVDIMSIKVTYQPEGSAPITTDYYTYQKRYQKENPLVKPFKKMKKAVVNFFSPIDETAAAGAESLNPFRLSKKDYALVDKVSDLITCTVDKKTDVISINVQDQDPVICAMLADSVKVHLQKYITNYRTSKAREDVVYYQNLTDSLYGCYRASMEKYTAFCDANQDAIMQSVISKRDEMENEMDAQYQSYASVKAQLFSAQTKVQERTPAFTTLQNATVPVKPAGPKRMIFVAVMLFLATIATTLVICRKLLPEVI